MKETFVFEQFITKENNDDNKRHMDSEMEKLNKNNSLFFRNPSDKRKTNCDWTLFVKIVIITLKKFHFDKACVYNS
jgi:hypothetical protein